ncbi:hypothetical protein CP532_4716 [Ophiocordyceps camponoti-leonardi (nom. inval.)]|nr:hypothetical protein CP532_4716 [Ophiocordyceps camponoti-leonardi (nom. inval.)]
MPSPCASQNGDPSAPEPQDEGPATKQSRPESRTPEHDVDHDDGPGSDSPGLLPPFDWTDFEARYEKALRDADAHEREILKEAQHLSTYFQTWASAAAAHDDERAVKRLRTRQRFVNLSEEKVAQKQQHYDEVVRAFESALALLRA